MDWIGKSWMVKGILSFVGFVAVLAVTQSLLAAILAMALVSWLVIFFYDIPRAKKLDTIKIHLKRKKYNADGGMLSRCYVTRLCHRSFRRSRVWSWKKFWEVQHLGIYGSVAAPTMIVQMGASYVFNPFITLFAEQYSSGNIRDFWKTFRNVWQQFC